MFEKPHVGHDKHPCNIVSYFYESPHVTLNEYKKLIRNPKFMCRQCGRTAAKEENLYAPVPL